MLIVASVDRSTRENRPMPKKQDIACVALLDVNEALFGQSRPDGHEAGGTQWRESLGRFPAEACCW